MPCTTLLAAAQRTLRVCHSTSSLFAPQARRCESTDAFQAPAARRSVDWGTWVLSVSWESLKVLRLWLRQIGGNSRLGTASRKLQGVRLGPGGFRWGGLWSKTPRALTASSLRCFSTGQCREEFPFQCTFPRSVRNVILGMQKEFEDCCIPNPSPRH